MNVEELNLLLSQDNTPLGEILPRLKSLSENKFVFQAHFGLPKLPLDPGILLIRGPRQFGKSTWLEQQISSTYIQFGPGSVFYLNGDEISLNGDLVTAVRQLVPRFRANNKIKRLFIDEITAIDNWERAIKLLADQGELQDILLVTTGSKATDIRRGTERLPGRKGRLARTNFIFTPISYRDFQETTNNYFGKDSVVAYILSGGSPLAANELAKNSYIPEYVITLTRDWLIGEIVRSGRQRSVLLRIFDSLHRNGASVLGYTKLAREVDIANNTVASGYMETLEDLFCIAPVYQTDPRSCKVLYRKACKFHYINSLVAIATSSFAPRSIKDFKSMPEQRQGVFLESLVAQEFWRRSATRNADNISELRFFRHEDSEIDFVLEGKKEQFLEVKRGQASPHEFDWLFKLLPKARVKVICTNQIQFENLKSLTMEDFLLDETLVV